MPLGDPDLGGRAGDGRGVVAREHRQFEAELTQARQRRRGARTRTVDGLQRQRRYAVHDEQRRRVGNDDVGRQFAGQPVWAADSHTPSVDDAGSAATGNVLQRLDGARRQSSRRGGLDDGVG